MEGLACLAVLGVPLIIALVWALATYNRFVSLRNHIRESWAGIGVELQRRYDLIPNLVETVKGYAEHERETLARVTELRRVAQANQGRADAQATNERALESALTRLLAVAERYPDLKADRNFLELQAELANTEDRLAATRRFYNANVRTYRTIRQQFPTSIIAEMGGFGDERYFELTDERARQAPRVDL